MEEKQLWVGRIRGTNRYTATRPIEEILHILQEQLSIDKLYKVTYIDEVPVLQEAGVLGLQFYASQPPVQDSPSAPSEPPQLEEVELGPEPHLPPEAPNLPQEGQITLPLGQGTPEGEPLPESQYEPLNGKSLIGRLLG